VTRARVFELAAQLGYQYMELRAPAKRRSVRTRIGALVCYGRPQFEAGDRYENPGQMLLAGVSELSVLRGFDLELHYVSPGDRTLDSPSYAGIKALRRERWHGVLLIYPFPATIVEALVGLFPCVSLVKQYSGRAVNCVDVANYRGICLLMERLLKAGHKRIGFYSTGFATPTNWVLRRFSAYFETLISNGIPYHPEDVVNVLPNAVVSEAEGWKRVRERIDAGVTAWICAADYQAYSLIAHLQLWGFKIPQQVSITGFDGIAPPEGAPILSTMEIPFREIGITGGRRLLDLINNPFDPVQHILLDCHFRDGQTIAPVPVASEPKRELATAGV
jgi:DNA-binding LacI/PurR family transcriptional regulator